MSKPEAARVETSLKGAGVVFARKTTAQFGMTVKERLRAWRQRYRSYRIREREAHRSARDAVEQTDRDINLAGQKKQGPPQ